MSPGDFAQVMLVAIPVSVGLMVGWHPSGVVFPSESPRAFPSTSSKSITYPFYDKTGKCANRFAGAVLEGAERKTVLCGFPRQQNPARKTPKSGKVALEKNPRFIFGTRAAFRTENLAFAGALIGFSENSHSDKRMMEARMGSPKTLPFSPVKGNHPWRKFPRKMDPEISNDSVIKKCRILNLRRTAAFQRSNDLKSMT